MVLEYTYGGFLRAFWTTEEHPRTFEYETAETGSIPTNHTVTVNTLLYDLKGEIYDMAIWFREFSSDARGRINNMENPLPEEIELLNDIESFVSNELQDLASAIDNHQMDHTDLPPQYGYPDNIGTMDEYYRSFYSGNPNSYTPPSRQDIDSGMSLADALNNLKTALYGMDSGITSAQKAGSALFDFDFPSKLSKVGLIGDFIGIYLAAEEEGWEQALLSDGGAAWIGLALGCMLGAGSGAIWVFLAGTLAGTLWNNFIDDIYGNGGNFTDDVLTPFLDSLGETFSGKFDPLTLDMNGNGVETLGLESAIYFDLDSNGYKERLGWVKEGEGILVRDINNNGIIDDGSELFGNFTAIEATGQMAPDGYAALAQFDVSGLAQNVPDGAITIHDPIYDQLMVWLDNENGITEAGELHKLADLDISRIDLRANQAFSDRVEGENYAVKTSSFTKEGQVLQTADFDFVSNPTRSLPMEVIDVPSEIEELPNVFGRGTLPDLHQAMTKDGSGILKNLVTSFMIETDVASRNALIEDIIFEWTGVTNVDPDSRGGLFDARKLEVLEKVNGIDYKFANRLGDIVNAPIEDAVPLLQDAYLSFKELVYSTLMVQTHLKPIIESLPIRLFDDEAGNQIDISVTEDFFEAKLAENFDAGKELLGEFVRVMDGVNFNQYSKMRDFVDHFVDLYPDLDYFLNSQGKYITYGTDNADTITTDMPDNLIIAKDGDDIVHGGIGEDHLLGKNGDDQLFGNDSRDTIEGGSGNDEIHGGCQNDLLLGQEGEDTIYGNYYHDTIIGGRDNDYLSGGQGEDVYVFHKGDGQDVIMDLDYDKLQEEINARNAVNSTVEEMLTIEPASHKNKIRFEGSLDDVAIMDLDFERLEDDLKITYNNGLDEIYIEDQFKYVSAFSNEKQIDAIILTNHKEYNLEFGTDGSETINLLTRNDHDQNVYVDALSGNDTVMVAGRKTVIKGGRGNDILNTGPDGDDVFVYTLGDGNDTINTWSHQSGGYDKLMFGEGIIPENVSFEKSGNDMLVHINMADFSNTITLRNQLISLQVGNDGRVHLTDSDTIKIDLFVFSNGETLTSREALRELKILGDSLNNHLTGSDLPDYIIGYGGHDTLRGEDHNDQLFGSDGDDTLYGGNGDDTLYGENGNDTLRGENGNDLLAGGHGDDLMIGGSGRDQYNIPENSGKNTIRDTPDPQGPQEVIFTGMQSLENTILERVNDDLILTYKPDGSSVVIENQFKYDGGVISTFKFSQNQVYSFADIVKIMTPPSQEPPAQEPPPQNPPPVVEAPPIDPEPAPIPPADDVPNSNQSPNDNNDWNSGENSSGGWDFGGNNNWNSGENSSGGWDFGDNNNWNSGENSSGGWNVGGNNNWNSGADNSGGWDFGDNNNWNSGENSSGGWNVGGNNNWNSGENSSGGWDFGGNNNWNVNAMSTDGFSVQPITGYDFNSSFMPEFV